jgi:hypothetical protein
MTDNAPSQNPAFRNIVSTRHRRALRLTRTLATCAQRAANPHLPARQIISPPAMADSNEYERQRLENIEKNKKLLRSPQTLSP